MIVLGLDTTLDACSAALVDGGRVLASRIEPMQRGHQERLAALAQELMAAAGLAFDRLDRVGVTRGPGSFTGLRVGLAFAKGLALALDIPCVGVGALEALAASAGAPGPVAAVVDARRGQVYLQRFQDGRAASDPDVVSLDEAVARLTGPLTLVGSGAPLLAPRLEQATVIDMSWPDPAVVARLAAAADPAASPPEPLYLRAPDARLPA